MAPSAPGFRLLVDLLRWVRQRPALVALDAAWQCAFWAPLLLICQDQAIRIQQHALADPSALLFLDWESPWEAYRLLLQAWPVYWFDAQPVLAWLLPTAAMAWAVASGIGRGLLLTQMQESLRQRQAAATALAALQTVLLAALLWGWSAATSWVLARNTVAGLPDVQSFALWETILSALFYLFWKQVSGVFGAALTVMMFENCSPWTALARSVSSGRAFSRGIAELSFLMGVVKLLVTAAAASLFFASLVWSEALHSFLSAVWWGIALFFLFAHAFFSVVQMRSTMEFCWVFRAEKGR